MLAPETRRKSVVESLTEPLVRARSRLNSGSAGTAVPRDWDFLVSNSVTGVGASHCDTLWRAPKERSFERK